MPQVCVGGRFSLDSTATVGLPSRTILDRTYSAQRFFHFLFNFFLFFFILGRAVD